jgi:hypothetical protein
MHMKKRTEATAVSAGPYVLSCAALALALAGCDAGQSQSEALGTEGGVVSLQSGLELSVPAGALQQRTQITIREHRNGDVTEIVLEPEGLELQQSATLGWSDDGTSECERASGGRLEVQRNGQRAQIQVQRFERLRVRTRARNCDGGNRCEDRCGQGQGVCDGGANGGLGQGGEGCTGEGACDGGANGGHGQGGEGCTGEGVCDGGANGGHSQGGEGGNGGDGVCNDGGTGPIEGGGGGEGDGDGDCECHDGGVGPRDGGGGGGPGPGSGSCGDGTCP